MEYLQAYSDAAGDQFWTMGSPSVSTVSYTHLDVYKRQHLYGENGGWKNREEATQNYAAIFLCHNSDEDIMVQY